MMIMERNIQNKINSEKGKSEKEQIWKRQLCTGQIKQMTIMNRNNLKKDKSEKVESEQGQFCKGTSKKKRQS